MFLPFAKISTKIKTLLVLLFLCAPTLAAEAEDVKPTAEGMMVRAHEARALWHNFPGFAVDVVVSTGGNAIEGKLIVSSGGDLDLQLPDSAQVQWANERLQSLVSHRLPRERERTFNVAFADEVTTHPLGRLIRFQHDPFQSVYRISGDVITEVHRVMGSSRFSISVLEVSRNAEGKHLPKCYSISSWDSESGNLTASDVVRNEWVRVKRWDLPSELRSVQTEDDGQREVRRVVFRNHRLLETAASE